MKSIVAFQDFHKFLRLYEQPRECAHRFLFFADEVFSTNSQSSLKRLRTNRQNKKLLRGPNLVQGGVGRNEAISPTGPGSKGLY